MKRFIFAIVMAMMASQPAVAEGEADADAITDAVVEEILATYDVGLFSEILITIQSQLVFVEAGGETIELALIYSIINDELGVLLTGEEEVTDDGVVISRLYTDGEWVTDLSYDEFCEGIDCDGGFDANGFGQVVSYDESCDGDDCDRSFDASGDGWDVSYDEDCDASGCEWSYDASGDGWDVSFDSSDDDDDDEDDDD
jgi:hypothetical protein